MGQKWVFAQTKKWVKIWVFVPIYSKKATFRRLPVPAYEDAFAPGAAEQGWLQNVAANRNRITAAEGLTARVRERMPQHAAVKTALVRFAEDINVSAGGAVIALLEPPEM
eukprot:1392455-Amphidinium_carterae.1